MTVRNAIRLVFTAAAILVAAVDVFAWEGVLKFRHYSVRQGLSDGNITALAQDRQGYLWVGTKNGLNRFDGYAFKTFRYNPSDNNSIAGNNIQCLYVGADGKIWVGLVEGRVSCYDPELETFRSYRCYTSAEVEAGDVSGITEAGGYVWVAVDRRGLVRLDPESGETVRYEHDPENPGSLSHNAVTAVKNAHGGRLWLTSWGGGLDLFDPETGNFSHYQYPEASDVRYQQIKCLYLDSQGDIWLGSTYLGVFFLGTEDNSWKHFPGGTPNGMSGTAVLTIAEDADRNVWVGFANGISIYKRQEGRFSTVEPDEGEYGLHSQEVTCLLPTSDGSMWVGTAGGLHQYNPSLIQFGSVSVPGIELQGEFIQQLYKDSQDGLWVRTDEGLMYCKAGKAARRIDNHNTDDFGRTLFEDSRGNVWIGCNAKFVVCYNLQSGKSREIGLPVRSTKSFFEDPDGTIWIGTELGLVPFDPDAGEVGTPLFASGELIFPSDKASAVLRDKDGNLWVGTQGGLKRFGAQDKHLKTYNDSDASSLAGNDITALYEDSHGRLWVGTTSGLDLYDSQTDSFVLVRRPGEQAGFPVMGITEDGLGRLWVTTSIGLVLYNPETESLHLFDEDDGLPSRIFVQGVLCKSKDGEIYAGTVNGTVRFFPENITLGRKAPQARLEDFQISSRHVVPGPGSVLEKAIEMTDKVKLRYDQSSLTFQFGTVDYLYPGKLFYAYRMTGVDDDWRYASPQNRQATYANLSPGNYVFEVKALDDNGQGEAPASLQLEIKPPFYRSTLAYCLYALLFVGFVVELFRWLRRRNARAMERLIAAQQHEMDELKFKLFTNISHEFRTSLTLIMGPLEYLLKDEKAEGHNLMEIMYRSAERLRRLVNQLLDFRKVNAGKMEVHATTQDLVPFLKEVFDSFFFFAGEKDLDYSFTTDMDSLVMAFDKDKLDKMVYNLLSNAFKYTDKGGKVNLNLAREGDEVRIRVTDNGVGISEEAVKNLFVRFYQASDPKAIYRGGSGLGLNMTHELALAMGGDIEVESEPGKGSAFTIRLPFVAAQDSPQKAELPEAEPLPEVPSAPAEREKELILVVEDNPDMQAYIRTVIGDEYLMVTASDGEEGLERAVELIPDIVISDVMMPRMDGLQMFARLKEDERISHIPVILLTAIQDEQRIAASLKMGINDYLTKPFSPAILLARIASILNRRQEMWDKKTYSSNPFVVKVTEIITERLSDSSLSLEYLADRLNMSTTQLTRKTKSLMDTTPYSLIIKLRMEQAVRYLKGGEYNISEIAYRCGYQEVSNFSRAFARYWGEPPTQYLKKVK